MNVFSPDFRRRFKNSDSTASVMIKNFKDTHHVAKSRETYKLKINGYVSINFLIYMFFSNQLSLM